MSETPAEPTQTTETPAQTPASESQTPPWGDNFDAETAWGLVQNLRAQKNDPSMQSAYRDFLARQKSGDYLSDDQKKKLAEYDNLVAASKTEFEKAQEAAGKIPALQAENLRLQVAIEKGLTGERADLVKRLNGETLEDLRADADALLALLPAAATQVPRPNPAQGAGGSNPETGAPQLTQNDLARMTDEQIVAAQKKGQLNDLLGVR